MRGNSQLPLTKLEKDRRFSVAWLAVAQLMLLASGTAPHHQFNIDINGVELPKGQTTTADVRAFNAAVTAPIC
jgi:hypothetical protein